MAPSSPEPQNTPSAPAVLHASTHGPQSISNSSATSFLSPHGSSHTNPAVGRTPSPALPAAVTPEKASHGSNNERLSRPAEQRIRVAAAVMGCVGLALGMSHGSKTTALRFVAENAHRQPTTINGWKLYYKAKLIASGRAGGKEALKMGAKFGFWGALFIGAEEMIDRGRLRVYRALFGRTGTAPNTTTTTTTTRHSRGSGRSSSTSTSTIDEQLPSSILSEEAQAQAQGQTQAMARERTKTRTTKSRSWRLRANDDVELQGRTDALSTAAAGLCVGGAFSAVSRLSLPAMARLCRLGLTLGLSYGVLQDLIAVLQGQRVSCVDTLKRLLFSSSSSSSSPSSSPSSSSSSSSRSVPPPPSTPSAPDAG